MTDAELLAEIEATPPARKPIALVPSHRPARAAPSEAEMLADLKTAEAAGDKELAQHIASRIGRQVKARYAGSYDDLPDAEVGRRVAQKLGAASSRNRPAATQIVEVPGVGEVEFPADATDAEIVAAIETHGPKWRQAGTTSTQPESRGPGVPGRAEAGVRGGLQGASFGFADEAAAAVDALLPSWLRNRASDEAVGKGETYGERYRSARDYYRRRNATAEELHPGTYVTGQIAGAVAAPGGALGAGAKGGRALLSAVGQGAAAGAGYSEADLTKGDVGNLATDMGTGAAFGVGGYGAGTLLKRSLARLAARGTQRQALAAARAGAQAADGVAAPIKTATGELGEAVQKGSRYVENLMRLEASMTPQQRALYQQLQQQGVVPNLQQAVAQSTLERLPGQAGSITSKQAELAALQAAAPQAAASRTAELLQPSVRADTRSMFKSYGEPAVAAFLAYKAADLAGADPETKTGAAAVAGLIAGRTRAGKALRTRINRPGNQAKLGRAEQKIAQSPAAKALVDAIRRGVPAAATDAAVQDEEARAEAELARLLAE